MRFLFLMKKIFFTIIISFAFLTFFSCQKDDFSTDSNLKLQFSVDTVSFDTVFTTIGTATKLFKVYNRNNKSLKINKIYLEKNNYFKINVDGSAAINHQFSDIEILANDSIFVFVTAKVDTTSQNTPLLIDDKVIFSYNNNTQNVVLEAFGQDVNLLRNEIIYNDTTFTAEKPFLIYDTLWIAQNATLTISEGVKMYFHKNAAIVSSGNILALGTRENPIIMRGDRLDNINFTDAALPYNLVSGQWGGVFILGEQTSNIFRNVILNSSDIGIYIENDNITQMPDLTIENCKFTNFSFSGLYVINANVQVFNSEISNSGAFTVNLNGGTHLFVHSTIANFYGANQPSQRDSSLVAVRINDTEKFVINKQGDYFIISRSITDFYNSIIMGNFGTEFLLETENPQNYGGSFKNSFIRKRIIADYPYFQNIRWYKNDDIVFKNIKFMWNKDEKSYYDFRLDSISPARDIGNIQYVTPNLRYDLNGNDRTADGKPDAGAYEWVGSR